MKTLIFYTLCFLLLSTTAGCGSKPGVPSLPVSPDGALGAQTPVVPVVVPVSPVIPVVTTDTFIFNNSQGICTALENWDSSTTTIVFPSNSGGSFLYSFESTGVYIMNPDGSNKALLARFSTDIVAEVGAQNNPAVCTWTVTDGELVDVR